MYKRSVPARLLLIIFSGIIIGKKSPLIIVTKYKLSPDVQYTLKSQPK